MTTVTSSCVNVASPVWAWTCRSNGSHSGREAGDIGEPCNQIVSNECCHRRHRCQLTREPRRPKSRMSLSTRSQTMVRAERVRHQPRPTPARQAPPFLTPSRGYVARALEQVARANRLGSKSSMQQYDHKTRDRSQLPSLRDITVCSTPEASPRAGNQLQLW